MRFPDMVFYSINALRQRQLRSWLTIFGIVVGITAIVVLVGLVQGLRDYFTNQLSTFGADSIIVVPINVEAGVSPAGASFLPSSGKLFMKDYERLKRIPEVDTITPVIIGRTTVGYKDKLITSSVIGIQPSAYRATTETIQVEKGRFLEDADQKSVVIGSQVANDTFGTTMPIAVSSTLLISGESYRVVGILNKTGNSFANLDSAILVPFDQAKALFQDVLSDKEINSIRLTVKEGTNVSAVAERIEDELMAAHRVNSDNKDFGVITADFINKQLDSVTGILGLFLGGVASISLLVGGIGIANTMFMSVTERRREIGILKSIGAEENEILLLFLIESSLIGVSGGLLGLALAYLLGYVISAVAGIGVSISPLVVAGAVIFSATIGIISGVYPARQAAELDPVEALRE